MKSILREFIREAVYKSAFGGGQKAASYGAESTAVYKRLKDFASDMSAEFAKDGSQTLARWLNNYTNRNAKLSSDGKYTPKRNILAKTMQYFASTPETSLDSDIGKELSGASFDRYKTSLDKSSSNFKSSVKSYALWGIVLTAVAAGSYYYRQKGEETSGVTEMLTDDFINFNSKLVTIINSESSFDAVMFDQGLTTFDNDWQKIQSHFQQISNSLIQAKTYEDYFRVINDSNFKGQVDSLIKTYTKDIQNIESAYEQFAFLILIYHTVNSYIPTAILSVTKGYGQLSDENQKDIIDFIEKLVANLKSSESYREAAAAYKDIGSIA
jgi:cytochrome c556